MADLATHPDPERPSEGAAVLTAPGQDGSPAPGTGEDVAWPPPRRSVALPAIIAAMLAIGIGAGAYMLWHTPFPPDPTGGSRCTLAFDARLRTARGGTDADLLRLSDEALAAKCGLQAFAAAEAVGGTSDEAAAWTLSRFYDPDETDPVFRQTTAVDPARAAAYDIEWASRSPRMANALRRLCATHRSALDRAPGLKGACGS